ncbi:MATE family efflux transporter [Bacteroidales bacterium OttesenSCG-928-M11]|nr:MATE family efflux transporter [Bacteroidales bacterium OttesenSCG-928-M11]
MSQSGVKDLTEGKIFKQLIQLALPLMATSFIQMAYTLTDMAWVGRLGSREIAAIGAVGILTWLTTSLGLLTKIGAEISIAQSIGAKRLDKARIYASHTVTISALMGLFFAFLLIFGAKYIVSFFRLEEDISNMAIQYLQIVSVGIPLFYMSNTFAGVYNGAGRTTIPFYLMASGLFCNMILDPLFIFGIGELKGFGTNGAALATVISQCFVFVLFVWQMKQNNGILNRFPFFVKLKKDYSIRIFRLGTPIALMSCFFAIINFFMARIASVHGGHLGVMSLTTGSQIEGITWNTSQGFSTALSTFVAQNYTAGKLDRTYKAYRQTLLTLFSLGIVVTLSFIFLGQEIFGIFVPEKEAMIAGGNYLFIIAFCQIFMMLETTTLGIWNGYGHTNPPAIISILFNLARIPMALFLAPQMGVKGVWIAITISSILKGTISFIWWKVYSKRIKTS